jgi:hypothetical protein
MFLLCLHHLLHQLLVLSDLIGERFSTALGARVVHHASIALPQRPLHLALDVLVVVRGVAQLRDGLSKILRNQHPNLFTI